MFLKCVVKEDGRLSTKACGGMGRTCLLESERPEFKSRICHFVTA